MLGSYIIFELQKLKGHNKINQDFQRVREFCVEKKRHFLTMEKLYHLCQFALLDTILFRVFQ